MELLNPLADATFPAKSITYTGTAGVTGAWPAGPQGVVVWSDQPCFVLVGEGVTATTSSTPDPCVHPDPLCGAYWYWRSLARECNPGINWWHGLRKAGEQAMSFGVALRNAVAIGLGGIASFLSGYASEAVQNNLLAETGSNLVQEDGGLILL